MEVFSLARWYYLASLGAVSQGAALSSPPGNEAEAFLRAGTSPFVVARAESQASIAPACATPPSSARVGHRRACGMFFSTPGPIVKAAQVVPSGPVTRGRCHLPRKPGAWASERPVAWPEKCRQPLHRRLCGPARSATGIRRLERRADSGTPVPGVHAACGFGDHGISPLCGNRRSCLPKRLEIQASASNTENKAALAGICRLKSTQL